MSGRSLNTHLAVVAREARLASALVAAVVLVDAGAAVLTWRGAAVVDLHLAVETLVAGGALAGVAHLVVGAVGAGEQAPGTVLAWRV